MKKLIILLLTILLAATLTACGNAQQPSQSSEPSEPAVSSAQTPTPTETLAPTETPAARETPSPQPEPAGTNAVVVYFSWSGNTEAVAEAIVQQTGADVFRIQPETPYTDDYDALLDIAKEEQAEGARPAISGRLENLEQYDVVFLGFPNWWGDMPMILYTFLDEYDLSGKTIAPFVTSGGSGFSGTINAIESAEPDAAITGGLSLGSSEAREPEQAVADRLQGLESGESGIKVMTNYDKGDEKMAAKIIVQSEQGQVTYELNGSAAASSLRGQLPLSLAVEDFSTNEKIFYPTQALDTTDSPLAKGGAGTLAYYAPWGDAVMFYGDFRENPDLFELGTATERADIISKMSGTITILAAE